MQASPEMRRAINERIAPVAKVAVVGPGQLRAGRRRSRLPARQQDLGGEEVFNMACMACHGAGVAGAPKFGDAAAWGRASRRAPTRCTSTRSKASRARPASCRRRAAATDLSDKSIMNAVDYMVTRSRSKRASALHAPTRIAAVARSSRRSASASPTWSRIDLDRFRLRQIRDRPRHLQYAVIRARRQAERLDSAIQQRDRLARRRAEALDRLVVEPRVERALTRDLLLACAQHARCHDRARLGRPAHLSPAPRVGTRGTSTCRSSRSSSGPDSRLR